MLTGGTSRGCVNRTDVLTIHLTAVNLHHLFKYRIDLKLHFGALGLNGAAAFAALEWTFLRPDVPVSRCSVYTEPLWNKQAGKDKCWVGWMGWGWRAVGKRSESERPGDR